jgi:hypothetical protein
MPLVHEAEPQVEEGELKKDCGDENEGQGEARARPYPAYSLWFIGLRIQLRKASGEVGITI